MAEQKYSTAEQIFGVLQELEQIRQQATFISSFLAREEISPQEKIEAGLFYEQYLDEHYEDYLQCKLAILQEKEKREVKLRKRSIK